MDNNIINSQLEALNNSLNYFKLNGYTIHKYHQEDKRKVKQLYFLTDSKGNSLTGHWDYDELNSFIRGYGKACNECGKAARLLEDLTPGGSEFYNDPQYCFNFVKEQLRSIPSQILPFKIKADKLKEQNNSLVSALETAQYELKKWQQSFSEDEDLPGILATIESTLKNAAL